MCLLVTAWDVAVNSYWCCWMMTQVSLVDTGILTHHIWVWLDIIILWVWFATTLKGRSLPLIHVDLLFNLSKAKILIFMYLYLIISMQPMWCFIILSRVAQCIQCLFQTQVILLLLTLTEYNTIAEWVVMASTAMLVLCFYRSIHKQNMRLLMMKLLLLSWMLSQPWKSGDW